MLPIVLDPRRVVVGLAGRGERLEQRRQVLTAAAIRPVDIPLAGTKGLKSLSALYVAGASREEAEALARTARGEGVLVNVEDEPDLCDFHVPATVRRGDLLLTVSTAGRSPGLVRHIREWLASRFGPEWKLRVDEVGARRASWRREGLLPGEISRRTRVLVSEQGWLG